jgi:hypothetical protein
MINPQPWLGSGRICATAIISVSSDLSDVRTGISGGLAFFHALVLQDAGHLGDDARSAQRPGGWWAP